MASTVHQIVKGHTVGGLIDFRLNAIEKLRAEPGRHLVFVRYGPDHYPHEEMVYNGPDIDAQQIVWAIDRGGVEDRHLVEYYPDRKVWLMQPDGPNRSLTPFSSQ